MYCGAEPKQEGVAAAEATTKAEEKVDDVDRAFLEQHARPAEARVSDL